ncbi:hypothetical protein MSAN_00083500 [Mycena sanguinolenta]|uniref:Integrase catalytic domain-containing protein n=1 Tax=Mycena sanguinolenta TaxID=230812 RepID=A0A8H6ZGW9_9AGAR|nr:hypothetical protein MSAN_00083500 [Mycena sanguinolenta]
MNQNCEDKSASVHDFFSAAEQHQEVIPPGEFSDLHHGIQAMTAALEDAISASGDPLTVPMLSVMPVIPASQRKRGRPRKEIDKKFLAGALTLRGPTGIARSLHCHARTVRRRALDYGLVEPGAPCYQDIVEPDGTSRRVWQSTGPPISAISNMPERLDEEIADILRLFPNFGRTMLAGALRSRGFRVPQDRIEASYIRVHGAPPRLFNERRIERWVYSVPGVNSLWHHDGQHSLIRWKFVTHAFTDGKSRLLTGARVSNNNRGTTVLDVMERAAAKHGWPSRLRGDHGTENILVARRMEEVRGPGRGSYIWGSSVHNIRMERLWVDYAQGVANKWVDFFYELELYYSLQQENTAHIWLLHHLFLAAIDEDVQEWVEAWNSHKISLPGGGRRSPRDMFTFGLLEQGPRGLDTLLFQQEEAAYAHIEEYGVDWEAQSDPVIIQHLADSSAVPSSDGNPFSLSPTPSTMNEVIVEPPTGPLSADQINRLDSELSLRVDLSSRDMGVRKLVWEEALAICTSFFSQN